jgi:hypothetical protein
MAEVFWRANLMAISLTIWLAWLGMAVLLLTAVDAGRCTTADAMLVNNQVSHRTLQNCAHTGIHQASRFI